MSQQRVFSDATKERDRVSTLLYKNRQLLATTSDPQVRACCRHWIARHKVALAELAKELPVLTTSVVTLVAFYIVDDQSEMEDNAA